MSGYFPVDHGDMGHPVFGVERRPYTRWEAYCWLLDRAAIASQDITFRSKPVKLDRGQVGTSIGEMARAWKWTKPAVQRFINGLISADFITYSPAVVPEFQRDTEADTEGDTVADTGVTVITLCKYSSIPGFRRIADTVPDTVPDTEADTVGAITPYMLSLNKRRKENKKEEREGTSPASPATPAERRQGDLLPQGEIVPFQPPDEQLAFDAYNALAAEIDLRECRSFSPARRSAMRARLRELGGLSGWTKALDMVTESPFIRTWRTDGWVAFGLHSLLQPNTLAKLMDGAYSGKRRTTKDTPQNAAMDQALDYAREHHQESFFRGVSKTGTVKI